MIYIIVILAAIVIAIVAYMNHPKFGRAPRGERLAKIERSANYRNGAFQNLQPTPRIVTDKSRARVMIDFLFEKRENNRPETAIPAIKTDLKALPINQDVLVWFGHSSYFIQNGGKRILVDPVFDAAAPFSFLNRPFKGTDIYNAEDMPNIDYLIITHDHWDHLDYETVTALKDRVSKVICPLGVGEHLEYWGYSKNQIVELDWNEKAQLESDFAIYCLPTRHFSGRTFKSNQTLWASYMLSSATKTIYLSGDGGYGSHFVQIAKQFPSIDLAIMENGQYNNDWRYIHLIPADIIRAIKDLSPDQVFTTHHSKYALAKHAWTEPLKNNEMMRRDSLPIITATIGEVIDYSSQRQ